MGSWWEVDFDICGGTEESVLNAWGSDLGANKNVRSEHELVVQVIGHLVKRELHEHGTDNGETSLRGLEEEVVHVMCLSVSLLDGSKDSLLDTRTLEPWLTHLESLLGVGSEEWIIDTELIELDKEIVIRETTVAWNIMTGIDQTRDTKGEEHVDREFNILELGVVASSSNGTVSLGTEEEGSGEKERSLLTTVTTEKTLEGSTLLESTIGIVDPSVLQDVTLSSHVSVIKRHSR